MKIFLLLGGFFGLSALVVYVATKMQPSLQEIHEKIVENYPNVEHINATDLKRLNSEDLVFIDVRELSEYAVRRLQASALRVDPNMQPNVFKDKFEKFVSGKTVIFYCSVGRRSSDFIARVQTELTQMSINQSYNLEGGLFAWANSDLSFEGSTVHPYNAYWGRLLDDPSIIAYEPIVR